MATLRITVTGEHTAEELQKLMANNAAYRTRNDSVMAANFIDAGEAYLVIPLSEFDHAGERARIEVGIIQSRLAAAIDWLESMEAVSGQGQSRPVQYIPAWDWNC